MSGICTHVIQDCDVNDTKKEVVFVTITSTKTYEVAESLICERKPSTSSDSYASFGFSSSCFETVTILWSAINQAGRLYSHLQLGSK